MVHSKGQTQLEDLFFIYDLNYPPYRHISIGFWIGYGHCYLPTQDKQTHIFV